MQAHGRRCAVQQALRAPFFRRRLAQIDVERLDHHDEWAKIPILDKEALRAMSDEEFYRDFCISPESQDPVLEFWRSGGSTGRPLFYPRSRRDLEGALEGFARVLACAGAPNAARVHCSFPLGIHPAGQMMVRGAQHLGMGVLMAGAGTTTSSAMQLELLSRLRPQVWMGMPSYGVHLSNLADQEGVKPAGGSVKLLVCSAEPMSRAKRDKLEQAWSAPVRDCFGMTEAGMMGVEDGVVDGFRIWSDLFLIEVVDPSTRLPVSDGQIGGLVVTPLAMNSITPFLRWYSGDLVSLRRSIPGNGPFSIFPVLKHAHRTTGFFKIRGVNISHAELEELLFRNAVLADFRCEAVTIEDEDSLRILTELKRGADPELAVRQLRDQVKRAFEISAQVIVIPSGTLASQFESTIKAARMIDRRDAAKQ